MKLKKITVGFLSVLLIIGSVLPTLNSVFATAEQKGWFLDFSSGAHAIENNVYIDNSVKTVSEYSETDKVAVFTSTESNLTSATRTPGIILGGTVTSKSDKELSVKDNSVEDYPIVAIRLKLSNPEIIVDRFDWTTDTFEQEGSEKWRSMTGALTATYSGTQALKATDEWQTVIIDTSKDTNTNTLNKLKGNWTGFRFLFKTPAGISENTSVSIAWIGVFKNVAEVPRESDAPVWLDFSDETVINKTVVTEGNLKTELGYNSEEQSLVLTSTEADLSAPTRTPGIIIGNKNRMDVYNSPVEKYPVIAAYIKLSDESVTFDRFDWSTTEYEAKESVPWRNMSSYAVLQPTTEWQLVYVDASLMTSANDSKWFKGLWSGFRMLFKSAAGKAESASVQVKWIGTFETVDDAKKKAGIEIIEPYEGEMLVDFAQRDTVTKFISTNTSLNTDFGYDETEQALKMTSKVSNLAEDTRTPGVHIGGSGKLTEYYKSSVTDYPVIAAYIKLSHDTVTFDRFDWTTTVYEESGEATPWRSMTSVMQFKRTTDWQLIYIDTRTLTAENDTKWLKGDWSGFRMLFKTPAGLSEPVSATVKWIGTFTSVSDAKKKAGIEEKGPVKGQMLVEFNSREPVDKYVRANTSLNTKFDYDKTENALTMTSTVSNLKEATRTPGIHIGGNGLLTADYITPVADYPVVAAYIKLSHDTVTFDRFDWTTTVYEESGEATPWRSMTAYAKFARTTDWQLVYIDTRTLTSELDTKWLKGNWSGFRLLFKTPAGLNESVSATVKWIGTFASVDDAKKKAGIEVTPPKTGSMVIEFNNRNIVDKYVKTNTSLNTVFDYDKTEDALKLTSTVSNLKEATRTPGVHIGGNGLIIEDYNSSVKDYPVIAAYIKLSDKTVTLDRFDWTTTVYEESGTVTPWRNASTLFELKATTDWQLVYFDTSKIDNKNDTVWLDGYWSGFRVLGKTAEGQPQPAGISVKWIASFESVSAAKEFAGVEDKKKSENPGFWKFDTEASLEQVMWSSLDDTDISFDSNESAMKIVAKDAVSGANKDGKLETNVAHFTLDINDDISCAQYRYLAVRVKISNQSARSGWYSYKSTDGEEAGLQYLNMVRPSYEKTDEWQTVIIDCCEENSMYDFFTGYWSGLSFDLALSGFAHENDTFWVSWIGLFRSIKELEEKCGIRVPVESPAFVPEKKIEENNENKNFVLIIAIVSGVTAVVLAGGSLVIFRKRIFKRKKQK